MVVAARKQIELDSIRRSPHAPPPASGPDRPSLHRRERSSPVKNRKLEICTSGSVGGRGGNTPTYPASKCRSSTIAYPPQTACQAFSNSCAWTIVRARTHPRIFGRAHDEFRQLTI